MTQPCFAMNGYKFSDRTWLKTLETVLKLTCWILHLERKRGTSQRGTRSRSIGRSVLRLQDEERQRADAEAAGRNVTTVIREGKTQSQVDSSGDHGDKG